jgi:hypothetical protein
LSALLTAVIFSVPCTKTARFLETDQWRQKQLVFTQGHRPVAIN